MNTLSEIIKKRRSVRIFKPESITKELVEKLIEAAIYAPSACDAQDWKFIIVDDKKLKDKIVEAGGAMSIKNAPAGILVLYDNRTKNLEYQDHIQSAAAAIQNIHLMAIELGLGSCWICHLPAAAQLRKIFHIPNYFSPIAYILLGYPAQEPQPMPRKYKLNEVMAYNKFSADWPIEKINSFTLFVKRVLVKIYRLSPNFIKNNFLNKFLDNKFVKKFKN